MCSLLLIHLVVTECLLEVYTLGRVYSGFVQKLVICIHNDLKHSLSTSARVIMCCEHNDHMALCLRCLKCSKITFENLSINVSLKIIAASSFINLTLHPASIFCRFIQGRVVGAVVRAGKPRLSSLETLPPL